MNKEEYLRMEAEYMASEHERMSGMRGCLGSTVIAIIIIVTLLTLLIAL